MDVFSANVGVSMFRAPCDNPFEYVTFPMCCVCRERAADHEKHRCPRVSVYWYPLYPELPIPPHTALVTHSYAIAIYTLTTQTAHPFRLAPNGASRSPGRAYSALIPLVVFNPTAIRASRTPGARARSPRPHCRWEHRMRHYIRRAGVPLSSRAEPPRGDNISQMRQIIGRINARSHRQSAGFR